MKRKRETGTRGKSNESRQAVKKQRTTGGGEDLDLSVGVNRSFAYMDSQLLADYVAQRTKKFESDLSSVELEDRYISGTYFYLK